MDTEMRQQFINYDLIASFDFNLFKSKLPFPWYNFHQFLTPEGFETLYLDFPSLDLFEKHNGMERVYGQRPHNRYYLAYESSIYNEDTSKSKSKGIIKCEDLPKSWQLFIEELENNQEYRNFMKSLFDVVDFEVRYAWHVSFTNSEVSPHKDADEKIGTHILYFNTSTDWNIDWGGSTLVLNGKLTNVMNPDFSEFHSIESNKFLDNHSFIFKNAADAWHGVKPLVCPEDKYRRLFNIIFEFKGVRQQLKNTSILSLSKKFFQKTISNFY